MFGHRRHYTLNRYRLQIDLPTAPLRPSQERILTISVEGRDTPMRTVFYTDKTNLPKGQTLRASVYRTVVTIDLEQLATG